MGRSEPTIHATMVGSHCCFRERRHRIHCLPNAYQLLAHAPSLKISSRELSRDSLASQALHSKSIQPQASIAFQAVAEGREHVHASVTGMLVDQDLDGRGREDLVGGFGIDVKQAAVGLLIVEQRDRA